MDEYPLWQEEDDEVEDLSKAVFTHTGDLLVPVKTNPFIPKFHFNLLELLYIFFNLLH